MSETELRHLLVEMGRSLFERGYSVGSAGNISVRLPDGFLITPTNSSLGRLKADTISKLDSNWNHIGGGKPSKEVFMHRAVLEARPTAGAVVHLHSTYATAVSCLPNSHGAAAIEPLTPYFIMRIGRTLPLVRYYRPGDNTMEQDIHAAATGASAMLLANHGSVVSGKTLSDAVYAAEELEEAAKLSLLLEKRDKRVLSCDQIDDLIHTFGHP